MKVFPRGFALHSSTAFLSLSMILEPLANFLRSPVALMLRLYFGLSMAPIGWQKLNGLEGTAGYFQSLNIPFPLYAAMACGGVECFGGILFALGAFTRPVSFLLSFTMASALFFGHWSQLSKIHENPQEFFKLAAWDYFIVFFTVFLYGGGKLSFDQLFCSSGKSQKKKAE